MTGKPRPDFAGAWHHVMNRGGRHAPIFEDDDCSDGVEDFMRNIHCVRHGPMVGSARHRDRVARRGHGDSQSFRVRALAANPARRFVVWALQRSTSLMYFEGGQRLGMLPNRVAKVLARLRANSLPPIAAW